MTTRGMVVLHVVAPAAFGGLERVVHGLSIGHAARGHQVHVVIALAADAGTDHPFLEVFGRTEVVLHPLFLGKRAYLRELNEIRSICRTVHPDVVHSHGYKPDVMSSLAMRKLGAPLVTTIHGFTSSDWKNDLYQALQLIAIRRFDAVIAVSRVQVEQLADKGIPRAILHRIPNAVLPANHQMDRVQAREALGVDRDVPLVGWIGRLSKEKAPEVFVQAMAVLPERLHGSIVGSGPLRPLLEKRVRQLDLSNRVMLHGAIQDAAKIIRAFDVLVISSISEGIPIVLFEAMSGEVPIVATAVGGVPDVLTGDEALLVPAGDPAAIASAVAVSLEDQDATHRRVDRSSKRLDAFAYEPWLAKYESVYRQIAAG